MNVFARKVRLFGCNISIITLLWFLLALAAALAEVLRGSINNYFIFEGVFNHTIAQLPLYPEYPDEYQDSNHYGPLFSIIIMPFALLPTWLGCLLWVLANAAVLWLAVRKLNLSHEAKASVLAIAALEMMTAAHNLQFNAAITAWLVFAYILVDKEKDFWATLLIAAGFLVKLYGIAGLLFFLFSKHKLKFIGSFIFWLLILFALPMAISSPAFIYRSYIDWYNKLLFKNDKNIHQSYDASGGMQDISVLGMIRRISGTHSLSATAVLLPAAALILLPLLRFKQYLFQGYRLRYLALVLISIVIFSSSAESPTYVIAMTGMAIWFVLNYPAHKTFSLIIIIAAFVLTSLSSTDLFPTFLKDEWVRKYALKAFFPFVIWTLLIAELGLKKFNLENKTTSVEKG